MLRKDIITANSRTFLCFAEAKKENHCDDKIIIRFGIFK